jgi:hypothetical protein
MCLAFDSFLRKQQGFYGGVQVDSSLLKIRHDVNRDFYGREVSAQQVLNDIEPPLAARPLYEAIAQLYAMFGIIEPSRDGDVQARFGQPSRSIEDGGPPPGGWLGSYQRLDYIDRTGEDGGLQGGSLRGEFSVGELSLRPPMNTAANGNNNNDVFV